MNIEYDRRSEYPLLIKKVLLILSPIILALGLLIYQFKLVGSAGGLTVEILAGYNLVVDSNVSSPSTYAPSVATVAGKFCNTGGTTLTNVWGYIGDYVSGGTSTPGIYPARSTSDPGFLTEHPLLNTAFTYRFNHLGGRIGTGDASRYVGTLAPGECQVQYWHFTYPQCETNDAPPCNSGLDPVWGASNIFNDDLWLNFDIWGTGSGGAADNKTWKMTMRNEISAMANKIEPNPDGYWFNKETTVEVGGVITSNGILYEVGNVNKGFDNNGDLLFDYNAWFQPVGHATYDPSCFRLIRVTGILTVSRSSQAPLIYNFVDKLFFTYPDIPEDNTGVRGDIHYVFQALNGPCSTSLSPYQEAASGADNEKFNEDYGTALPPIISHEPYVTIDKSTDPIFVSAGSTFTYTMPFQNSGTGDAGLTMSTGGVNMPLVISDTVPVGMYYVGGSATYQLGFTPNTGVTILYSTNSGQTFTTTDPGTTLSQSGSKVIIQWWLNDPMPAGATTGNYARYKAQVPSPYGGSPFIENCAATQFGNSPYFDKACATNIVQGSNSIGDFVWRDLDGDRVQDGGAETGIPDISVTLYWDTNGDGKLDSGDLNIATTVTDSNGNYHFNNLPNGNYLVQVDLYDVDIPTGYNNTTNTLYPVTGLGTTIPTPYNNADFGLGPTLKLDKTVAKNPVDEGDVITFTIKITNTRPASSGGLCTHTVWANVKDITHSGDTPNKQWDDEMKAIGSIGPDTKYAWSDYTDAENILAGTTFNFSGPQYGSITKVEALFSLYKTGSSLIDDYVRATLWFNDVQQGTVQDYVEADFAPFLGQSNQGNLTWDVTSKRTWSWSDFAGNLDLELDTVKVGGKDGATFYLDALGFRITTDQACGGSGDDITILPLIDNYDASKMQFLSATPPQSSIITTTTTSTITWNNLGPLYGGQTRIVTLYFRALDPAAASAVTNNTANVKNAKFGNGRPVNDAQDIEPVTIYRTARIGDLVWYNPNGNSTQDVGEPGRPGLTVQLCSDAACSTVLQTTTTNANGNYYFTARDGTYYVKVTPPTGSTQNYDPDSTMDWTHQVTVSGVDNLNVDFGYTTTRISVYGSVWEDNNGNGTQQTGENGFSGVTVKLCDNTSCNGSVKEITTTDSNGNYIFPGMDKLTSGNSYYIFVITTTLPSGVTWKQTVDPDTNLNSNTYQVLYTGVNGPYNFAYQRSPATSRIGDTIFTDWNGNGVQDSTDEGIQNVKIYLYEDANGNGVVDLATDALIGSTTTSSTGYYTFTNVAAGNYLVVVDPSTLPAGYVQTADPDQTGTCTICDNKDPITVNGTSSYPNEDFGYRPAGSSSIGDLVWKDINGDGIWQANGADGISGTGDDEIGLANITVHLYHDTNNDGIIDSGDDLMGTTSTNTSGWYTLDNLPAGNYLVQVDTSDADLPLGYVLSTNNNPLDVTLTTGEDFKNADFGFAPCGVIGDFVWQDNNGNGTQDVGESGIGSVTVRLWTDADGDGVGETLLQTKTTNASGYYTFTNIISGTYLVVVDTTTLPSGITWVQTGDPDATSVPCSGGECNNKSIVVHHTAQIDLGQDFGYQPTGVIGDTLWIDANGDGIRQSTETGIENITMSLYTTSDCSGSPTRTTTTNHDGYYSFGGLPNGTYCVKVDTTDPDFPSGLSQNYDPDSTMDGKASTIVMSSGHITSIGGSSCSNCDLNVDFGYYKHDIDYGNDISGTIFIDRGTLGGTYQSGTDLPVGNVIVYLYDSSGNRVGDTQTISTTGVYTFSDIPNGTYTVVVRSYSPQLVGLTQYYEPDEVTYNDDGNCTTGTFRNDTIPGCNNTVTITVTGNQTINQQDFGYAARMDCGDLPVTYNSAPAYYRTQLAFQGPCSIVPSGIISPTIYLGATWDNEFDGIPDAKAEGDDDTDIDDEDGVYPINFDTWDPGDTVSIQVTKINGDNGYLVGWFDWNNDGDFFNGTVYDTGEYVYFGVQVKDSSPQLSVTIPLGTGCCTGERSLNVRFRLLKGSSPPTIISPTGNVDDGEVEDYQWPEKPTAVGMASFTATSRPSMVLVNWETAMEMDTLGFYLYRSTSLDGERILLTPEMIPSKSPIGTGASYQFKDTNVQVGVTYYYWLEILGSDISTYGPAHTTVTGGVYLPILVSP